MIAIDTNVDWFNHRYFDFVLLYACGKQEIAKIKTIIKIFWNWDRFYEFSLSITIKCVIIKINYSNHGQGCIMFMLHSVFKWYDETWNIYLFKAVVIHFLLFLFLFL